MKPTLVPGLTAQFAYRIPDTKTVPNLYPEADEFQEMPEVFATGFMVGLMEWTCLKLLAPHLDEGEGSLGTHINVSHAAATPPGLTVTVDAECIEVRGPRLKFHVRAHDGVGMIGEGEHERFVVTWERFDRGMQKKLQAVREAQSEEAGA
ncbi:Fluoroacetyl-CoA thioesterase [Methyloligella halotolerans]|uniref:Fluoroacetyl-CoA thioesterase n=1 Tax=Methyloligella halotolerans TaxID=1177755 RepID=A0A1E2S298_9HYPH|nr:thioesterase family protein [Methyloligella halotolerans]ODA68520.1 Fluoroacetyl-CoA thioesterase [Methyloligella halotolerans]